jgi:fumarylacetoacetase
MRWSIGPTHDPALRSWVESANVSGAEFPVQNLPYCVFSNAEHQTPRIGTAIGSQIMDLRGCLRAGLLEEPALANPSLNRLMALPLEARAALRERLSEILRDSAWRSQVEALLMPAASAVLRLPAEIGDYSDFYASIFHATSVGRLFRPDEPLLPNYKYVPIGYHGRASSIVMSGSHVRRPRGQYKPPGAATPVFGPTRALDFELEAGFFTGRGNDWGETIPVGEAQEHLFGLCLLNDWSARDIQAWEYQPLGPFLAKSFATTISPWVVTMEALAPYRVPASRRAAGDPAPLDYLHDDDEASLGGIDATLEVYLSSAMMRERRMEPVRITHSNLKYLYWTPGQLVAHNASNGCNLCAGDLLGTGTVSGPDPGERGCLLEITQRGAEPLRLPTGETRAFLDDGDEVVLRGYCRKDGFASIGLGECRGVIAPAKIDER